MGGVSSSALRKAPTEISLFMTRLAFGVSSLSLTIRDGGVVYFDEALLLYEQQLNTPLSLEDGRNGCG